MTALLRTEGIRKAYGGVHALDTCTVEVEEGTVAGLIGPNGSGKTTLFNVITGYAKADAGHVYLDGKQITNVSPDKVFALGIGRTFQLTRIFASLTVLENMLVASPKGRAAARRHAMEQLDFVGIAGHHAELAGTLSYGQRKLLELAYVLVADPAVILLDERRRRQPVAGQPHRRPDPRAERGRQDVPDRRAQHGVRDGPVRPGHRARLGLRGGQRPSRHHQDRPPGAQRLPG